MVAVKDDSCGVVRFEGDGGERVGPKLPKCSAITCHKCGWQCIA